MAEEAGRDGGPQTDEAYADDACRRVRACSRSSLFVIPTSGPTELRAVSSWRGQPAKVESEEAPDADADADAEGEDGDAEGEVVMIDAPAVTGDDAGRF
ncbi:hypothetical protein HGRIS_001361 [Hohenbuehelia grisea]|uniref:Uncharacterized protein n=1 Tax=Hohenbuehelia grisea TaxID=104357 RepID=A0ABR3JQ48_9AGAR